MTRRRGRFVTFEGIEGSGKTTQIERLGRSLRAAGLEVIATREPGGTAIGRRLRALLLDAEGYPVAPATELLLYSADRAQHLIEMIGPALGRGAVVLCDRYLDATLAYQGYGRMLGTDAVLAVHRIPPLDRRPDRTVLLDLDPAEGLARARSRNVSRGTDRCEGRYEMEEIEFHGRVRRGYLDLAAADPERIRVVQAAGSEDEVAARVRAALADLLPEIDGGAP
jgi:dTMP kinase